ALAACALAGCSAVETSQTASTRDRSSAASQPVTLLAFGDSGYHYDYLKTEDYETWVTEQQFLDKERRDWIEDKRPIAELAYPPMHRLPRNGSVIAASGLSPTAKAMRSFCAQPPGCDFAAVLGDNIYPDGATAGADGQDDAARFRDLFMTPF